MTTPSPTQADVARLAGVSTATVCMALRRDPRISKATHDKVLRAAKTLRYFPDPVLSALIARRDRNKPRRAFANLAGFVDDFWYETKNIFWLEKIIKGMTEAANRLGYQFDILHLRRDLGGGKSANRILHARGIRGIAILPLSGDSIELELDWAHYACISMGNEIDAHPFHRVGSDCFASMNLAVTKLKALGYKRIGLAHSLTMERRLRYEWLGAISKEAFLPKSGATIVRPHLPQALETEGLLRWFRKEKPDCIVSANYRVYQILTEAGIRIPDDVGTAFLTLEGVRDPDASGVSQNLYQGGVATIEYLHALLLCGDYGFPEVQRETLIYPHWIEGKTVKQLAA